MRSSPTTTLASHPCCQIRARPCQASPHPKIYNRRCRLQPRLSPLRKPQSTSTTTLPLHHQLYHKLNLDYTQTTSDRRKVEMSSAYQAPTTGATAIATHNTNYDASTDGPAINYLCGDCNSKVSLKRAEPIRCKECGHRVLYKERTKRYATF